MKWMTKTKKKVVELKEDDHQEEGGITQGGQPPRIGQQSSRKMTTRKKATKLKKGDHQEVDDQDQEEGGRA